MPSRVALLGDDEVGGVGGVALGWEWVLDVGEAEVGLGDLALVEVEFGAVREAEIDGAGSRVDAGDRRRSCRCVAVRGRGWMVRRTWTWSPACSS